MREFTEISMRETTAASNMASQLVPKVKAPAYAPIAIAGSYEALKASEQNKDLTGRRQGPLPPESSRRRVLSAREREVLALVVGGSSSKEGGLQLGISRRTFEVHRAHIMKKIGARNTADLVRLVLSAPAQSQNLVVLRDRQAGTLLYGQPFIRGNH
jgi:DNA-binding CsgD family transcriptional regulator